MYTFVALFIALFKHNYYLNNFNIYNIKPWCHSSSLLMLVENVSN